MIMIGFSVIKESVGLLTRRTKALGRRERHKDSLTEPIACLRVVAEEVSIVSKVQEVSAEVRLCRPPEIWHVCNVVQIRLG
jgi:hypothetical protein